MSKRASRAVISDFVTEVRDYLPRMRQAIGELRQPGAKPALVLEESHRLLHTIKGAASMIGLTVLGRLGFLLEELLEDVMAGIVPWSSEAESAVLEGLAGIGGFLDELDDGRGTIAPVVHAMVPSLRRVRRLEPAGDEAEVASVLSGASELEAPPGTADAGGSAGLATGELAATFRLEAEELLETIGTALRALEADPADETLLGELRRPVHTLKGSAATVGAVVLSRVAHRMEDLLDLANEGSAAYTPEAARLLADSLDLLTDLASDTAPDPVSQAAALEQRYAALVDAPPSSLGAQPDRTGLPEPAVAPTPGPGLAERQRPPEPRPDSKLSGQSVRVPIERLDEMVRLAGELVVNRSSFEQTLGSYRQELDELRLSMERLKRLVHRLESDFEAVGLDTLAGGHSGTRQTGASAGFDALEFDRYTGLHLLSRELAEASADIGAAVGALGQRSGDFTGCLERLARLTGESEDKLMRMRMVPLGSMAGRLHRAVRVASTHCSKPARLVIEGEWIELDKTVLEQIAGPLEHLLRNAVDHGIEPGSVRAALGKPAQGQITLKAWHEGAEVVLEVSDDGAGLDPDVLRETAMRKGFLNEAAAATLIPEEALRLIFQPGFSTASMVTEVSGRGVGMDAVRTAVHEMRGTVEVEGEPGQGARFTVRLPLTLAVMRVLMIEAGGERLAIPLASVVQVLRLDGSRIETAGGRTVVRLDHEVLPGVRLNDALGLRRSAAPAVERPPAIVVQAAGIRAVLLADHVSKLARR
ncbi:MAG: chemotaxis protein CheA [Acidobacteria bacterium]|nr:chemotaxis protein CheA [Acidobacteriota bacterium]